MPSAASVTGRSLGLPSDSVEQGLGRDFQRSGQAEESSDRRLANTPLNQGEAGLAEAGGTAERLLGQVPPLASATRIRSEDRSRLLPSGDGITLRGRLEDRHIAGQDEKKPGSRSFSGCWELWTIWPGFQ